MLLNEAQRLQPRSPEVENFSNILVTYLTT